MRIFVTPHVFTFTGDSQIVVRSAAPLLGALTGLGVKTGSTKGCIPITVCGPWKGGRVNLSSPTSQYLSALLIAAPLTLAGTITEINGAEVAAASYPGFLELLKPKITA